MLIFPAPRLPEWIRTYAAVILAVSLAVNLVTSFSLYVQALTIPGMKNSFDLSYTTVFVLVVALSISRVVSGLVSGAAASRYGGRWMVIASVFAQAVSMVLLGWSPNYWVALAAMIVVGVSSGAALTPMMGMLASWFRATDRGVAAGIAAAGGSLSIVFTGVIVPPLTFAFGDDAWRYTWYVLAMISVLLGCLCVGFIRERSTDPPPVPDQTGPTQPQGGRTPARIGPAGWPVQVYTIPTCGSSPAWRSVRASSNGILTSSYGAYLEVEHGIEVSIVGALFMIIGILSIGSGVGSGALSDRVGRGMAFGVTFLLEAVCHAMFWMVPELWYLVVASVLAGFCFAFNLHHLRGGCRRFCARVHGAGGLWPHGHGSRPRRHHLAGYFRAHCRRHGNPEMVVRHGVGDGRRGGGAGFHPALARSPGKTRPEQPGRRSSPPDLRSFQ